ncbi:MAG: hypothetical protein ACD_83C00202G0005, partial [uncultured bacterium]
MPKKESPTRLVKEAIVELSRTLILLEEYIEQENPMKPQPDVDEAVADLEGLVDQMMQISRFHRGEKEAAV